MAIKIGVKGEEESSEDSTGALTGLPVCPEAGFSEPVEPLPWLGWPVLGLPLVLGLSFPPADEPPDEDSPPLAEPPDPPESPGTVAPPEPASVFEEFARVSFSDFVLPGTVGTEGSYSTSALSA